jgi:hypothetical protein
LLLLLDLHFLNNNTPQIIITIINIFHIYDLPYELLLLLVDDEPELIPELVKLY